MKELTIRIGKILVGIIFAIVMIDVVYHSFIFNVNEYNLMQESQSEIVKMLPDWVRWLIYDISKLL
jgi:hypothetical protein